MKKIKRGDLVQVLPARFGHYIVVGRSKMDEEYVGRAIYWDLVPLSDAAHDYGGPMDERYIEVVSEG
tara:strand:+ start:63 stop:263 length:201 start_codon:yes stop_codon:yes gene_type:complete